MKTRLLLCLVAFIVVAAQAAKKPNIIYILADDMGPGDVKAINPDCKIATPNLDALAHGGMIFTDAHSSSSVCTPTRYGVLTGRYNWRTRLQKSVCWGFSRRLIEQGRTTVADYLKTQGYATAAIGKWHLGMDWPLKNGGFADDGDTWNSKYKGGWDVDYTKPIVNGPTSVGFDHFFGISASLDMPPFVYIDGDRALVTELVEKKFMRSGPADVNFEDIDVLPLITEETVQFIDDHAKASKKGEPFFIYFPLNAPHTPIVPTPEWQGRSGINPYSDFVMQVDWTVGQVMKALKKGGIEKDTLVIFTADNGCSPQGKFSQLASSGHFPGMHYRGHKADIFEGGHRVPFIAHWPREVKAGTTSDQTICLTDLYATCAEILGDSVAPNAAEDSVSILPALLRKDKGPLREATVHHSINGAFSIRKGPWKLELCPGSGGWSAPRPGRVEMSAMEPIQLYHLENDPGETTNVQALHPQIVKELTALLESYVAKGRSTPGPKQKNDGTIDIWKAGSEAMSKRKK